VIIPEAARKLYKNHIESFVEFLETASLSQEENWVMLEKKSHGIAGSSAFFGDKFLVEVSQDINTLVRTNPPQLGETDDFKQKIADYINSLKNASIHPPA
jgi:hypothetical protein